MASVRESILENKIRAAKFAYYHKKPILTDEQYDALEEDLRRLNPSNPVLSETGAPANLNSVWPQARHSVPMTSLSKAMNMEEFKAWWQGLNLKEAYLSEKQDGISLSLVYEHGGLVQAIVRGDGISGDSILPNALKMRGVVTRLPDDWSGLVRGEIRMSKTNLAQARLARPDKSYANCRNTASGLAREEKGELAHLLDFVAYNLVGSSAATEAEEFLRLKTFNFNVSPGQKVTSVAEVASIYQAYQEGRREKLDYDIDGLVITVNDVSVQDELGSNSEGKPLSGIALKFPPRLGVTTIKNIRWEVGDSGRFCPVAEVDPLELDGATVRNVSLHNLDFILMHEVTVGSTIKICRSGDIIPYLVSVESKGASFWKN